MASTTYSVSEGSITWDKEESEVTQDEVAYVDIKAVGWTKAANTASAMYLIPDYLPVTSSGPCGAASIFSTAQLFRRGAKFAEGMIRVEATFRAYVGNPSNGPGGGTEEQNSTSDKTGLRIATVEEPLLTHPVAQKFPRTQINLLSALISGFIRTNWDVEQEEGGSGDKEFVRQDPTTNEWSVEARFSETEYSVTVAGRTITASPLDFARFIKASVTTYKAQSQNFTWTGVRKTPASASELNKVGSIVNPQRAPNVTDREWFYDGLMENQVTADLYEFSREFILSGPGGAFKQLYAGGTGDINANP
jgi:hypothetical protein